MRTRHVEYSVSAMSNCFGKSFTASVNEPNGSSPLVEVVLKPILLQSLLVSLHQLRPLGSVEPQSKLRLSISECGRDNLAVGSTTGSPSIVSFDEVNPPASFTRIASAFPR